LFIIFFVILFFRLTFAVKASGLSAASAVLSNPRLSYEAGVSTTIAAEAQLLLSQVREMLIMIPITSSLTTPLLLAQTQI